MANLGAITPQDWQGQMSLGMTNLSRTLAWQKALEDAGLKEALDQVHQFGLSTGPKAISRNEIEPRDAQAHGEVPATDYLGSPGNGANANHQNGEMKELSSVALSRVSLPMMDGEEVGPQLVWTLFQDIPRSDSVSSGNERTAPTLAMPISAREWQRSRISVSRSTNGATLYVRDAAMAPEQLASILAPLKERMAALGVSLVGIHLNGLPIWVARRTESVFVGEGI